MRFRTARWKSSFIMTPRARARPAFMATGKLRAVVHQNPAQESAIVRCSKSSNFRDGFWSSRANRRCSQPDKQNGNRRIQVHSEAGRKEEAPVYAATA